MEKIADVILHLMLGAASLLYCLISIRPTSARLIAGIGVAYGCGPTSVNAGPDCQLIATEKAGRTFRLTQEDPRIHWNPSSLVGKWIVADGSFRGKTFLAKQVGILDRQALFGAHADPTIVSELPREIANQIRNDKLVPFGARSLTAGATKYPFLTIPVRLKDHPNDTPHPQAFYQKMFGSTFPSLDLYYQQSSYGKISLSGSAVTPWVNLSKTALDYQVVGGIPDWDQGALITDAANLVKGSYDLKKFSGVNVMANASLSVTPPGFGGSGGDIWLNLDGTMRLWKYSTIPLTSAPQALLWHEIGHSLGFDHSSGPYATSYDSHWDQMSNGYGTTSDVGPVGVQTNAYHRQKAGWLPMSRTVTVLPGGNTTVRLERISNPSTSDKLMARIYCGTTGGYYTAEARKRFGYDAGLPAEGIVLYSVVPNRAVKSEFDSKIGRDRTSQVVDPDNNGDPNDAAAIWTVGETFHDYANGVTISVLSSDSTGYTLHILVDPVQPMPSLVWSGSISGGGSLSNAAYFASDYPSTTVSFALKATDPSFSKGYWRIPIDSALPTLTQSGTIIDGSTQSLGPASPTGAPLIFVDGSNIGPYGNGVVVAAPNCQIRGLAIGNFPWNGIDAETVAASGLKVQGCFVGVDPGGVIAPNRQNGIVCAGGVQNAVIGGPSSVQRNVVSGNVYQGIFVGGAGTAAVLVQGNYCGISPSGNTSIGNGADGIHIDSGASKVSVVGNVASGNGTGAGILLNGATSCSIRSNCCGLGADLKLPVPNSWGILLQGGTAGCTVGGPTSADRNLSGDNTQTGIATYGTSSTNILGNWVGFTGDGQPAGNQQNNINVGTGSTGIGISNNYSGNSKAGDGILVWKSSKCTVTGNRSGFNPSGFSSPNANNGISVSESSTVTVGGGTPTLRNYAAGNAKEGIAVGSSNGVVVVGNWVGFNVAGQGIDNGNNGISVSNSSSNVIVGQGTSGFGNLVGNCKNGAGVGIWNSSLVKIQGNQVGFSPSGGSAPVSSNLINIGSCTGITIGGPAVAANFIGNSANGAGILLWISSGSSIAGNVIGFSAKGFVAPIKGTGIVCSSSTKSSIGLDSAGNGNVVGNCSVGIGIYDASASISVRNNTIGLPQGTHPAQIANNGIELSGPNLVTLGGSTPLSRNIIYRTGGNGIGIWNSKNTAVQSNLLGTSGSTALGGFLYSAIYCADKSTGTTVKGNTIRGTSGAGISGDHVSGLSLVANDISGIPSGGVSATSCDHVVLTDNLITNVGGDGFSAGGGTKYITLNSNTIHSCLQNGIALWNPGTTAISILGNRIGLDAGGLNKGNGGDGVVVGDGVTACAIGSAADPNRISFNKGSGIRVLGDLTMGIAIRGNLIDRNAVLGINLAKNDQAFGVTLNDALDLDTGPNGLQNFPLISKVVVTPSRITVQAGISAKRNSAYLIDLFASSFPNPSGYGEGSKYLGSVYVLTDATGVGRFSASYSPTTGFISATATEKVTGSTSEFSKAFAVP